VPRSVASPIRLATEEVRNSTFHVFSVLRNLFLLSQYTTGFVSWDLWNPNSTHLQTKQRTSEKFVHKPWVGETRDWSEAGCLSRRRGADVQRQTMIPGVSLTECALILMGVIEGSIVSGKQGEPLTPRSPDPPAPSWHGWLESKTYP